MTAAGGGVLRALDFRFTVTDEAGLGVESLFASFTPGDVGPDVPPPTAMTLRRADDDFHELHVDGTLAFRTLDPGVLVHQTVWDITRRGVQTRPDAVILHAAMVRLDGVPVLISGRSGAGKSTLTAQLVAVGAVYGTDEAVVVEPDGTVGDAIRRPVQLHGDALQMLGFESQAVVRLPDGSGYVGVAGPGADPQAGLHEQGTAVMLLDERGGDLSAGELRRSELVVALLHESFHGTAATQVGLETLKNLSTDTRNVSVSGGTVLQRANLARNLAADAKAIA